MQTFRVALLQLLPAGSEAENLQKGLRACREAKERGADLALFPEMWNSGYDIPQEPDALRAASTAADGAFVRAFGALAAELEMAIGVTFLEQTAAAPRNSLCVFDRFGRRVLAYSKVHTCDFGRERVLARGNAFPTALLDTAEGAVRIGAMICYDREFPESARILMLHGAEVILVPNACPMEQNRLAQLRARAFENMVGIATVNYPAGKGECNGHSTAFDGIVYAPGETAARDTLMLEADEQEGIYLANFPMDALRAYRAEEVHGNAYRRPELYGALVETAIEPPFCRADRKP